MLFLTRLGHAVIVSLVMIVEFYIATLECHILMLSSYAMLL